MSTKSDPMSLDDIIEDSLSSSKTNEVLEVNSYTLGDLRSIDEIHPKYRHIFQYPFFNKIQSKILDDVLYTDKSIVVSAPTGSGKTVVLELAIVHLLMKLNELKYKGDFKIVYMAPVKALCSERLSDWYGKFSKLGLPCIEVTGDTDSLDFSHLKHYRIIMTTPEKWDSLTRKWKDHKMIVQMVKLFIIDEVHLLNEDVRGPVLEAVVSRMKTIQASISLSIYAKRNKAKNNTNNCDYGDNIMMDLDGDGDAMKDQIPIDIRFIAVSATIPNAEDIAEWLGTRDHPAACFKIGEEYRPVKLIKIVEGFPCKDGQSLFKFDMYLSYKVRPIIERYCNGKPTIIFCNTRKSVVMTAEVLSREIMFQFSQEQSAMFSQMASRLSEKKLQVLVKSGIGCHHAGFLQQDRNIIEQMFRQGCLPLLITTSTLAMGVNLPAHLVILKTTQFYNNGSYQEYEESTVLQMMGRAGRPQFDTEGIAVIMTRCQDRERYTRLCGGSRAVESALHRHLAEHLNAEAALGTLTDLLQAMDWIRSTFLYVRAVRHPAHYGYPAHIGRDTIEKRLEELCLKCVNALARAGMLTMDSDTGIVSTEAGSLMAANCLDFETMKIILKIKGTESLSELLSVLTTCHEYSDLPLRAGEKRCLNLLNRKPRAQSSDGSSCRFPQPGRIQTREMKVNCLIQAIFGCLPIPDPSLQQETSKVLRTGEHISKCIVTYMTRSSMMALPRPIYQGVLNSVILAKCFSARLWDNSCYVVRQLNGIGPTFATLLASAGKTTFESIRRSNPRDLERIMNKLPPAGNTLKKQVMMLPIYEVDLRTEPGRVVIVTLSIKNNEILMKGSCTTGEKHKVYLIIGDSENNLLLFDSILDSSLLETANAQITRKITPKCLSAHTLFAHCISNTWVGLDVQCSIKMKTSLFNTLPGALKNNIYEFMGKNRKGLTKNKDNFETLEESEAIADLTPQIQREFMNKENDICFIANQTNLEEKVTAIDKPKKIAIKKKALVKKDEDLKNGGKNCIMQKINKYIKSIPGPSYLNTLSTNISYYKPLPKTVKLNNSDMNSAENTLRTESTNCSKLNNNTNDNDNGTHFCKSDLQLTTVFKNSTSQELHNPYYKCVGENSQTQQTYCEQKLHVNMNKPKSNSDKNDTKNYFYNNTNDKSQIYNEDCVNTIWPGRHNIGEDRKCVESECTPVIEDILNLSDDESFDIWCKKLETENTKRFSTNLMTSNFPLEKDQSSEKEREDYYKNKNINTQILSRVSDNFQSQLKPRIFKKCVQPASSKLFSTQAYTFRQHNDLMKRSASNKKTNVAKLSKNSKTINAYNRPYNETKSDDDLCHETYSSNSTVKSPHNEALSCPNNSDDWKVIDNSLSNLSACTETFQSNKNIKVSNNNIESITDNFKSDDLQEIKSIESNFAIRKEGKQESFVEIENISSTPTQKIMTYQPNADTQVIANTVDIIKESLLSNSKNDDTSYEQNIAFIEDYELLDREPNTQALEEECKVINNEKNINECHEELRNPPLDSPKRIVSPNDVTLNITQTALCTARCLGNKTIYDKSFNNPVFKNNIRKTLTGIEDGKYVSISAKSVEKPLYILNSSENELTKNVINLKTNQCDSFKSIFANDVLKDEKSGGKNEKGGNLSISFKIQNNAIITIMDKYCHKLYGIAFNTVHRPFSFDTLRKKYNSKKIRYVTWSNPLVLPTKSLFIHSENYSNESQIRTLCSVRNNLSLVKRNNFFKSVPLSLLTVIKSIIEMPVENILSIYNFLRVISINKCSLNGCIQISSSCKSSKMCYDLSFNKVMQLDNKLSIEEVESNKSDAEDIQMLHLLQKDNKSIEKNVTKSNNANCNETKIANINIINSSRTEVENEDIRIPQQLSMSEHKQNIENNNVHINKIILNKESFVREWLNKSPFHSLPDLNQKRSDENTHSCEELNTNNAEQEETITNTSNTTITNEKENHFGSMLAAVLFKHESKFHSEQSIKKINNFDLGVEDLLEITEDFENKPEIKLGPTKDNSSGNENKLSMNTVFKLNDEDIFHLYRDSHNSDEIVKYSSNSEYINPNVNKISDSIENNLNSGNVRLSNDSNLNSSADNIEEDWLTKSDFSDFTNNEDFDSDYSDQMDENMLNPQIVLSSAYCDDKVGNGPQLLNSDHGKNSSNITFFEGKNIKHSAPLSKNDPRNSDADYFQYGNSLTSQTSTQKYDNNINHLRKQSPKYTEKSYKRVKPKNIGVLSKEQINFTCMKYRNIRGNQKMQSQPPTRMKQNQTFPGLYDYNRQKCRIEQKSENTSGGQLLSQFQMTPKTKFHHP